MDRHVRRKSEASVKLKAAVTCGQLLDNDAAALMLALEDLETYWERHFGPGNFHISGEDDGGTVDLRILIGHGGILPEVADLEESGQLPKVDLRSEGFALDMITVNKQRLAVLRAVDRLGLQYAVYGFAEHFLGMCFVHPLIETGPASPPAPKKLHIEENPSMPMRVFYETSHVAGGLRGTTEKVAHFSDVGAWRWEDWAGNSGRMRCLIAWAVKNRANVVAFDFWSRPMRDWLPSDDIWAYMDLRGLKTILDVNAGPSHHGWDVPGVGPDDCCSATEPIGVKFPPELCINKPGFWKAIDEYLKIAQIHAHRLAGLICYWNEGSVGCGATEGAGRGVFDTAGGQLDTATAQFLEPKFFNHACPTCDDMHNVEQWIRVLNELKGHQRTRDLPPIGLGRTNTGIASPDDTLIAREVVPHLPPGSLSLVCSHTPDLIESWPRLIDEANAADNGDRRLVVMRELTYGCKGDIPLVHGVGLDRVDEDFSVCCKYKCTASCFGGTYVFHSIGWLMVWYSMRKQWDSSCTWQSWLRSVLAGPLGRKAGEITVDILESIRDIQLYEGLEKFEYASYYSRWGLDLHKLAPETMPSEWGPFASLPRDHTRPFIRLVVPGAEDLQGRYTSKTCAPAEKRIRSMLAKLDRMDSRIEQLTKMVPVDQDAAFWHEHLLRPFRLTASYHRARLALSLSYCCYVAVRDLVTRKEDALPVIREAQALCREALKAQEHFVRLRPGFSMDDYPQEIDPQTVRQLLRAWQDLARCPETCVGLSLCGFLDQVEREASGKRSERNSWGAQ